MEYSKVTPLIRRRLSYVVAEIKSADGKYDQAMSLILRVLSNYASIGIDAGSFVIKCKNYKMSKEAKVLRNKLCDDKKWSALTINEHPVPLKHLWKTWVDLGGAITEERVWNDLLIHPMVTVTKEEDARLRDVEKDSSHDPLKRYLLANIEV